MSLTFAAPQTLPTRTGLAPVPAVVLDVEVTREVAAIAPARDGRRVLRAWLLVRVNTEPLGNLLLAVPREGLPAAAVSAAIEAKFGPQIRARTLAGSPYLNSRAELLRTAPPITVVVCTRERPDALRICLESLQAQEYPHLRVLVVDNAPATDATARVVAEFQDRAVRVDSIVEPLPGLSRARNAAVAAAPGEVLGWIDDDVVADPWWLAEVARALAEHPDADVVSGMIVPAELETDPQLWFEEFGGHSKGRGFTPDLFGEPRRPNGFAGPASRRRQHPLYPLPAFGTGANMVFRPGVIEGFGGFDPALGAGTPAMGSEDTRAFMQVLYGGGRVAYQPTALVRHYHRRDLEGLRRQLIGYGVGLTGAYTSLVLDDPRIIFPLLRLLPTAIRDVLGGSGLREAGLGADFPRELLAANRYGMLRGPLAYLRGRREQRSARRRASR